MKIEFTLSLFDEVEMMKSKQLCEFIAISRTIIVVYAQSMLIMNGLIGFVSEYGQVVSIPLY